MFNNLNVLFVMMMFISSLMSISSSNWFGVWMGLEFNMLSFVPFLIENKNMIPNESALKYFIVQAAASSLFMFSCLTQSIEASLFWNFFSTEASVIFMTIALMVKLGAAPFQAWFILIISSLSWLKSLLLFSWQKMAPLFILSYTLNNNKLILFIAIISAMTGALGGLTQTSLKKILAFSSISHLGWMFSIIYFDLNFIKFYFFIYSFLVASCIFLFKWLNMNFLTQNFSLLESLMMSISFLSLGGLPPFLGFFPKWIVIQQLMYMNMFMINFILIMSALITLFFYTQIIMNLILMNFTFQKWMPIKLTKINFIILWMSAINSLGLIIINLFM